MIQKVKNNPFARNSLILFIGTMGGSALNYLFHLVIGRMVGVEVYGEVESLISLINIISVPAMTLTMVATKYSAACKADNNPKKNYFIIKYLNKKILLYGLPLFVLIVFLTPLISQFLKVENQLALIIVWVIMLFSFFMSVNTGTLQGWQRFKDASLLGVFSALIKLVTGILLVKIGFELSGAIGSFALGMLAAYLASLIFLRFIFREKSSNGGYESAVDFVSIKSYIIPVLIGNLSIAILGNADMVLAKHNLNSIEAGQYGALFIVSRIIFFATGVIASVLFSMSAENHHKKGDSVSLLKNALFLTFFVSAGAVIIYFVFPKLVLGILFGDKYLSVASYLGWFAIAASLFSFVNLILQYMLSIHRTKFVYSFLAVSAAATLAVLLLGTSIRSILAITAIAQIISISIGLFCLKKGKRSLVSELP